MQWREYYQEFIRPQRYSWNREKGAEVQEEIVTTVRAKISDDGMEAYLLTNCEAGAQGPSTQEIAQMLQDLQIVVGIREITTQAWQNEKPNPGNILIAEGTRATQGHDGWIDFLFKKKANPAPETEIKKVDFHELAWIHNVLKSEVVAVIHPAEPGVPGVTVTGKKVDPKPVKQPSLKLGKGVASDPKDPLRVIAQEDGNAVLDADGTIHVDTIITIHGNVDYSTGNIEFVGSVIVMGDVKSDFSVKAKGSIEISGNVEDATIEAGGDVTVRNGFIGTGKGVLVAGGKAVIHHVLNQKVTSASDVIVVREAVCAKITAARKIDAPTAVFVGCILEAGNEIEVCNLGNGEEGQSRARVGRRGIILERVNQVEKEMAAAQKQAADVKDTLYKLVRLQLDKGSLSPEQQQLNGKLRALQTEVQRKIEELQKNKESVKLDLDKDSMAQIIVRDTLFPNVSLEMNGLRKLNHNALKEVILTEHGGKIEEKPLESD